VEPLKTENLKIKHLVAENPAKLAKKINNFFEKNLDIEILDFKYFAKSGIEVLILYRFVVPED
jgi:hypothetical protein